MCFYFFRIILKEIFIEDLYILTCHLAYREICSVIGIGNSYFFLFMIKHLFSFHFFWLVNIKWYTKKKVWKKINIKCKYKGCLVAPDPLVTCNDILIYVNLQSEEFSYSDICSTGQRKSISRNQVHIILNCIISDMLKN